MNSLRKLLLSTALSGALAGSLAFALPGAPTEAGGLTPAMAMLTAYSRTLTDEVAAYEATYTGASHKTMFDHYGLLTFAPNNLNARSNEAENVYWSKIQCSVTSTTETDPFGGSTAREITESGGGATFYQPASNYSSLAANARGIYSVYIKPVSNITWVRLIFADDVTATNSIIGWFNLSTGVVGSVSYTGTGASGVLSISAESNGYYRVSIAGIASTSTSTRSVWINSADADGSSTRGTGSVYNVYGIQSERVTHETTPRAYNATTSAVYYGPRFVYAPDTLEASTTSITIGSGSSYTFTTAAAHSFAVGDVVQATDNADPDNWIRGYVTDTTSTTVTLASYTFPGTAYSRPVLTNGSGTISDWSVIRSDGYLAEPAATNVSTYSNTFTSWTTNNITVTAAAATSPDGAANATKINPTSTTDGYIYIAQTITAAAWTQSFYIKTAGVQWAWIRSAHNDAAKQVWFDLVNGVLGTEDAGTTGRIESVGDGWYRCSVTSTSGATSGFAVIGLSDGDNSSATTVSANGIYIYGAQAETGSVATSYIPTAAAPIDRVADVASMTSTNFSGWFNASEGTIIYDATPLTDFYGGGFTYPVTLDAGINDRAFLVRHIWNKFTGNINFYIRNSADTTNIAMATAVAVGYVNHVIGQSYSGTSISYCIDGTLVASSPYSVSDIYTPNRLQIFKHGTAYIGGGTLKEAMYFNTRESDAQLVTLTGG